MNPFRSSLRSAIDKPDATIAAILAFAAEEFNMEPV
jgi:hypothetical protein